MQSNTTFINDCQDCRSNGNISCYCKSTYEDEFPSLSKKTEKVNFPKVADHILKNNKIACGLNGITVLESMHKSQVTPIYYKEASATINWAKHITQSLKPQDIENNTQVEENKKTKKNV